MMDSTKMSLDHLFSLVNFTQLDGAGQRTRISQRGSKKSKCGRLNRRNRHSDFYPFMGK